MNKLAFLLILFLSNYSIAQTGTFPRSRPNVEGVPTTVSMSFYVVDIERIDSKEQSFTLDVIIIMKWSDPRIIDAEGPFPLYSIWQPNVQFYNLREVETRYPEFATILDDSLVQYTQRYYIKLSSPLDLKDFPFDVQSLPITLYAFGYSPDEVKLEIEVAACAERFAISDWQVEAVGANESEISVNLFNDGSEDIKRSRVDYAFKARRYIHFYLWKVLAPLMVILFLAWAVFWIDPMQVGAQIGVSGTSILTLIAFLYKLDNILPPVSYLTHLDHFIFTALLLVFFAYLEALISTTFAMRGNLKLAKKLDLIFRIGYPIVLLILVLIYWA